MKRFAVLILCLLIPATSWAFPDNGVLTNGDFPGADNTTPPTSFTNGVTGTLTGALRIRSTGATSNVNATYGDAYYTTPTYGANCEAYATLITKTSTNSAGVFCRLATIGTSTTDGYAVFMIPASNQLRIYVLSATGTLSQLGANISQTVTAGDSVGIRTVGTNICAWYKTAAGSWSEKGCRSDTTYSAGGAIGLGVNGSNTVSVLDNFGGGTITVCGGGASPTWTAPALDQVTVNDCIAVASTGDTINLPAGTATWTTTAVGVQSVIVNKGVTLAGTTSCTGTPVTCVDGTIINDGTTTEADSDPIYITGTNARVTGISFKDPRVNNDDKPIMKVSCANCRVDHCSFIESNTGGNIPGIAAYSKWDSTELFDHNYIRSFSPGISVYGTSGEGGQLSGTASWAQPLTLGDANATYIEDNNFDYGTSAFPLLESIDSYAGARLVIRFNTMTNVGIQGGHGFDSGSYRSTLRQETYRNTETNNSIEFSNAFGSRGGVTMLWQNTVAGTGTFTNFMWLRNFRSGVTCAVCGASGLCDGSNVRDQNTTSAEGYACRDQVGRGPTTSSTEWPNAANGFSQPLTPSYAWGNTLDGSTPATTRYQVFNDLTSGSQARVQNLHIIANREFYTEAASFNGTTGTGTGTHAARLALSGCTIGVAFWETDTGEWDSTNGATADGRLYRCTATNTWTLFYGTSGDTGTPYTYPHPLQEFEAGGGGGGLPTAPTNLRLISQAHNNSACLTWTASGMANLMGYRIYHGTSSGVYDPARSIALNSVNTRHMPDTQYCYSSALGGTHYFSVTAYDNGTLESDLATEVSATFTALSRSTATARSGR